MKPEKPITPVPEDFDDFEDEDLGESEAAETPADACHIGQPDCESCQ